MRIATLLNCLQKVKMKAYHLPLRYELQNCTATYHHEELPSFKDLRECSPDYQKFFDGKTVSNAALLFADKVKPGDQYSGH